LQTSPGVRQATIFGQSIHAMVDKDRSLAELGLDKSKVLDAEPSLEDVFVTISRAQEKANRNGANPQAQR
jgi:ABC-2 type transport system ATP-binding protein